MNFASDNVTGCCPEVAQALLAASTGAAIPYGNDDWTRTAEAELRELFEKPDLVAFPVMTGTAANCLALATLCPPWGSIACHTDAHVNSDEATAPVVMTGGAKLLPVDGPDCKLFPEQVTAAIRKAGSRGVHRAAAKAMTLTQATELGTLYQPDEIDALCAVARDHGLAVHMDGARFANAVMSLGVSPADMTWRCGVDALSFGATKNGAWAAEAVIFFDPAHAEAFQHHRKRTGHLLSKGRFLGIQLSAYLQDGVWLRNAAHANGMARTLSDGLAAIPGVERVLPTDINEIFVRLPEAVRAAFADAGVITTPWPDLGPDVVRMVCAFDTRPEDVETVLALAATATTAG